MRQLIIDLPLDQLRIPRQFTAAEREVLMLVLEGLSNEEIAQRRGRSVRTIANQLAALLEKGGVSGRTELLARCAPRDPKAPELWQQLVAGHWRVTALHHEPGHVRYVAEEPVTRFPLTAAELAVVDEAARGTPDKLIADKLGLGIPAAGKKLACALRKLGIARRTQLPLLRGLLCGDVAAY